MDDESIDDYCNKHLELIDIEAVHKKNSLLFLRDVIKADYFAFRVILDTKKAAELCSMIKIEIYKLDNLYTKTEPLYYSKRQISELNFVKFGWANLTSDYSYVADIEVKHDLFLTEKGKNILNGCRKATGRPYLEEQKKIVEDKHNRSDSS